jgi:hypothetical protein
MPTASKRLAERIVIVVKGAVKNYQAACVLGLL